MFFWNGPWLLIAVVAAWFLFGRRRWYRGARLNAGTGAPEAAALRQDMEEQREYIAALESRVAELENRQDFMERMLTAPHEGQQSNVM